METPAGPEDVANFVFTTEVKPWRKHLKEFARQNRRQPTGAENILWQALRNSKLGVRFRRQHAIEGYIVDFICVQALLTIELDGEIHLTPEHAEYDAGRTFTLTELGYRELRFTNQQVLTSLDDVLTEIAQALKQNYPEPPSGTPSPRERGPGVRLPRTTCPN
jgi:ATP-dependent DNA helicase RecQ